MKEKILQVSTVNGSIFPGFPRFNSFPFQRLPTKALEFFTLRSSLFTSFNPMVLSLPQECLPQ